MFKLMDSSYSIKKVLQLENQTKIKYIQKNNDECIHISKYNFNLPTKLKTFNDFNNFETCFKSNPEKFNQLKEKYFKDE